MNKTAKQASACKRGMSEAPYLHDAYLVAELTDSQDRCIASVTLVPGIDRASATRVVEELLDAVDPPRRRN